MHAQAGGTTRGHVRLKGFLGLILASSPPKHSAGDLCSERHYRVFASDITEDTDTLQFLLEHNLPAECSDGDEATMESKASRYHMLGDEMQRSTDTHNHSEVLTL